MIQICSASSCTGCMACLNACPARAIRAIKDDEGFTRPVIDQEKCIDCGKCQKVCSVNRLNLHDEPIEVFSGWNNNEEDRKNSSSGGVFTALAKKIIAEGGIVYGAAFDKNLEVAHNFAVNADQLSVFQGSKYVQSDIGESFKEAEKSLHHGIKVLFSGTPCQINGLKNFLGKDYENLITIDIVCHGVPSPRIFEDYKKYLNEKKGIKIKDFRFRSKIRDWKYFSIAVNQDKVNDRKYDYVGGYYDDPYIRGFLRNLYLRPSCHECKFCKTQRAGDITLADWWGYQSKGKDDKNFKALGVSLILANSEKGLSLIQASDLDIRSRSLSEAKETNQSLYKSFPPSKKREQFWEDYNREGFDYVKNKYLYPERLLLNERIRYMYPHSLTAEYVAKAFGLAYRVKRTISPQKKIYLICEPYHANLGDQAQYMCIRKWVKDNLPEYKLVPLGEIFSPFDMGIKSHLYNQGLLKFFYLKFFLRKDDIFLGHSGYFFQEPHAGWFSDLFLMKHFPNQRMIVFPQTVNFKLNYTIDLLHRFFDKDNILLLCRDQVSYGNAKEIFRHTRLLLYPDIVTSMIGTFKSESKRSGVLFVLRNDLEKFYGDDELNVIIRYFKEKGERVEISDTTLPSIPRNFSEIEETIYNYVKMISSFKVVITDRYHGTIFSIVSGTPLVILKSQDHKLTSGKDWFPEDIFGKIVFYADSLLEAQELAKNIISKQTPPLSTNYFNENYWYKLKDRLELYD